MPPAYIQQVFDVMRRAHWHRFQVLTKRASRLAQSSSSLEWTPNIWMGVSVRTEKYRSRIDNLRRTGASIKFLSLKSLLGSLPVLNLPRMDRVIVGGKSGSKLRPMEPAWEIDLREQCRKARFSFFFKQWDGKNNKKAGRDLEGRTWNEKPSVPAQRTARQQRETSLTTVRKRREE